MLLLWFFTVLVRSDCKVHTKKTLQLACESSQTVITIIIIVCVCVCLCETSAIDSGSASFISNIYPWPPSSVATFRVIFVGGKLGQVAANAMSAWMRFQGDNYFIHRKRSKSLILPPFSSVFICVFCSSFPCFAFSVKSNLVSITNQAITFRYDSTLTMCIRIMHCSWTW